MRMPKFIDRGLKRLSDKEITKEHDEMKILYDMFLDAHNMSQAQAYSFAMNLLTDLLTEIQDPQRKIAMIMGIPGALMAGMEIKKMSHKGWIEP